MKLLLHEPVTAVSKSAAAVAEESRCLSTSAAMNIKPLFFYIDSSDTILPVSKSGTTQRVLSDVQAGFKCSCCFTNLPFFYNSRGLRTPAPILFHVRSCCEVAGVRTSPRPRNSQTKSQTLTPGAGPCCTFIHAANRNSGPPLHARLRDQMSQPCRASSGPSQGWKRGGRALCMQSGAWLGFQLITQKIQASDPIWDSSRECM